MTLLDGLRALVEADARVVLIGGMALRLHGSAYITQDIDFCFEQTRENARSIVAALKPFAPRPREFPRDLPFVFDAQSLMSSDVITLETRAGDIDLLATVAGIGRFREVDALAEMIQFEHFSVRVLTVDGLILAKTAANRPKDHIGLVELNAIREARARERDR